MVIEIDDRLFRDISAFCEANTGRLPGPEEYVRNAVRERYFKDKYGDLNEIVAKASPVPESVPEIVPAQVSEGGREEPAAPQEPEAGTLAPKKTRTIKTR